MQEEKRPPIGKFSTSTPYIKQFVTVMCTPQSPERLLWTVDHNAAET